MNTFNYVKKIVSFIIHGTPRPTYAKISYLQPYNRLNGKRIIVTGGGRGLGLAMAKKFIEEGASVLITGRDENILKETSRKLGCKYLQLDVQNTSSFKSFIEEADILLGGANCLINNAGISLHENSFLEVSPKQFDEQFDTNLKGAFFLTQCFMEICKQKKTQGIKKILFTSSETSMTVDERPYGLTKAALNSLVQGLACKYVKEGYRINAIAPGITATEMTGYDPNGDLTLDVNPTKRVFLPEEIAEVASFLCCDASNIINGQILFCNEGKTINARWK